MRRKVARRASVSARLVLKSSKWEKESRFSVISLNVTGRGLSWSASSK